MTKISLKKRLFCFFFSLLFIVSLFPAAAFADNENGEWGSIGLKETSRVTMCRPALEAGDPAPLPGMIFAETEDNSGDDGIRVEVTSFSGNLASDGTLDYEQEYRIGFEFTLKGEYHFKGHYPADLEFIPEVKWAVQTGDYINWLYPYKAADVTVVDKYGKRQIATGVFTIHTGEAPPKLITNVALTGLTIPTAGVTAGACYTITLPKDAPYEVDSYGNDVEWYWPDGMEMHSESVFGEEQFGGYGTYTCKIELNNNSRKFYLPKTTEDLALFSATINGKPADAELTYYGVTLSLPVEIRPPFAETVAAPAVNIAGGIYDQPQNVSLSCATPGAKIRYTTDGNNPTAMDGEIWNGTPIPVDINMTIKARAYKEGMNPSQRMEAEYFIKSAVPVADPPAGTYDVSQTVSLSCANPVRWFIYTTDGSEPTSDNGEILEGRLLTVDRSMTLKIRAVGSWDYVTSDVMTAIYIIKGTPLPVTGIHLDRNALTLYSNTAAKTYALKASVIPANATYKDVTWTSSNTSVAAVDANGLVTAVGNGTADITATASDGGYTATCAVTVAAYTDSNSGKGNGNKGSYLPPDDLRLVTKGKTTTAIIDLKPHISGGIASATILSQTIKDALNLIAAAIKAENPITNIEVNLDTDKNASRVDLSVSTDSLRALAESNTETSLTLISGLGTILLDKEAIAAVAGQANGREAVISIKQVEHSVLTEEQRNIVGDSAVIDLSITSGRETISSFGNGNAIVSIPYTLKPGEKADGITIYYLSDNSELVKVKGRYDTKTRTAIFETGHFSKYVIAYEESEVWENPYTDVSDDAWCFEAIRYAHKNALFTGTDSTTFCPNTGITRAMLVTVLWRLADEPPAVFGGFTDTPSDTWYSKAASWALANDVVTGYGGGLFGPNDDVTREQMAVILYRYAQKHGYDIDAADSLFDFADAHKTSVWAKDAMKWAVGKSLLSGKAGSLPVLDPKAKATRAEAATILMRFFENVKLDNTDVK